MEAIEYMKTYPHLTADELETLLDIDATPEQLKSSDQSAKRHIDLILRNYNHPQLTQPQDTEKHLGSSPYSSHSDSIEVLKFLPYVIVTGTIGSGKSATANTILGERKFEESSSAVTSRESLGGVGARLANGSEVMVFDTPESWDLMNHQNPVMIYVIVINLASPRFDQKSLQELRRLKDPNGDPIASPTRSFVVLSHADSALHRMTLEDYLREIQGDPLHQLFTKDMQGQYLAVNNSAETGYERQRNQQALHAMVAATIRANQEFQNERRKNNQVPDNTGVPLAIEATEENLTTNKQPNAMHMHVSNSASANDVGGLSPLTNRPYTGPPQGDSPGTGMGQEDKEDLQKKQPMMGVEECPATPEVPKSDDSASLPLDLFDEPPGVGDKGRSDHMRRSFLQEGDHKALGSDVPKQMQGVIREIQFPQQRQVTPGRTGSFEDVEAKPLQGNKNGDNALTDDKNCLNSSEREGHHNEHAQGLSGEESILVLVSIPKEGQEEPMDRDRSAELPEIYPPRVTTSRTGAFEDGEVKPMQEAVSGHEYGYLESRTVHNNGNTQGISEEESIQVIDEPDFEVIKKEEDVEEPQPMQMDRQQIAEDNLPKAVNSETPTENMARSAYNMSVEEDGVKVRVEKENIPETKDEASRTLYDDRAPTQTRHVSVEDENRDLDEDMMDESETNEDGDNPKVRYPHLSSEQQATLEDVGATPEQYQRSDAAAKRTIDNTLSSYRADTPEVVAMVIGTSGAGKSATANTLLGQSLKVFKEGSSAEPVTTEARAKSVDTGGVKLTVVDTPRSWETQVPKGFSKPVNCYVIVINLASPRFGEDALQNLKSLKGADGFPILTSGRCVVALSHADSALHRVTLSEYLGQIQGDPLHTLLTDQQGSVLAVNNASLTEYERDQHCLGLRNRVFMNSAPAEQTHKWSEWMKQFIPSRFQQYWNCRSQQRNDVPMVGGPCVDQPDSPEHLTGAPDIRIDQPQGFERMSGASPQSQAVTSGPESLFDNSFDMLEDAEKNYAEKHEEQYTDSPNLGVEASNESPANQENTSENNKSRVGTDLTPASDQMDFDNDDDGTPPVSTPPPEKRSKPSEKDSLNPDQRECSTTEDVPPSLDSPGEDSGMTSSTHKLVDYTSKTFHQ